MTEKMATVSGGRVWNFSGHVKGKTPYRIVFKDLTLFLFLGFLISTLITLAMTQFNATTVDFSGIINSNTPKTTPDTGFVINNNVATEMFSFKHVVATLIVGSISSLLFYPLFVYKTTIMHKVILIVMMLTLLSVSSSAIATSSGATADKEMSMQTWMEERYDFTPKKHLSVYTVNEEDIIREQGTSRVAELRRINNEFFLYDMDGKELPLKSVINPAP